MAFIPVPRTIRVAFEYSWGESVEAVNVFHVRHVGAVTEGVMATLAEELHIWWDNELRPLQGQAWRLDRIMLRDLTTADSFEYVYGVGVAGGLAEASMPANVTIALSLRTGLSGRSFRGRLFHIGFTDPQVNGNALAVGVASDLLAAYAALLSMLPGVDCELVVVSYQANGEPRAEGLATPVISISLVNQNIDHQDRRLPRRH